MDFEQLGLEYEILALSIFRHNDILMHVFTWNGSTLHKCISFHAIRTFTHWHVVQNLANGTDSTRSRAGINAFSSTAGLIPWTI